MLGVCILTGKTWMNLRSLSVSCWYLNCPAHSITLHAPRSSSNPMARSASRHHLGMSSPYLEGALFRRVRWGGVVGIRRGSGGRLTFGEPFCPRRR